MVIIAVVTMAVTMVVTMVVVIPLPAGQAAHALLEFGYSVLKAHV